jgi:hypothetical protein
MLRGHRNFQHSSELTMNNQAAKNLTGLALAAALAAPGEAQAGWDKPFDKGGPLSINKVPVPKELQIGKVKTIQEVIFPICWGRPQECRPNAGDSPTATGSAPPQEPAPYFISARFKCVDRNTGKKLGSDCTISIWSKVSCQDALDALTQRMREADVCTQCTPTRDPSCVWDGVPPEHIQGDGPCVGW